MINGILAERQVLITCGTGGVGKTTVSSAIAIRAALQGKRVAVITIDPAKRLATSLGLERLENRPVDLTDHLSAALKKAHASKLLPKNAPKEVTGRFYALMPDAKRNFQDFLQDLAPTPEVAKRILANPIFQIFMKEFSGTNEYMALERLHALEREGRFDLIVLDTPPSRNALAFLNAPKLLTQFFEESFIRWLVLPANRLVAGGMKKALGILEKLTGAGFMSALVDFASTLFEVKVQFMATLEKTTQLLASSKVGFLMVTAPTPESTDEMRHFIGTLKEHGFRFDGIALNRSLSYLASRKDASPRSETCELLEALLSREAVAIERIRKTGAPICAQLPELARDIHSVEDLLYVAMALDSSA